MDGCCLTILNIYYDIKYLLFVLLPRLKNVGKKDEVSKKVQNLDAWLENQWMED